MHILFLSANFFPEVNAPASRTLEHCTEWVKCGHNVTVLTSAPNFPFGKVFPGYANSWYSFEKINGINVVRVKTFITPNSGRILRVLNFISYMLSSFCAGLFIKKIDFIVGTSPQFFTIISAYILAKLKRTKFIFELRDFWPDAIVALGAMNESIFMKLIRKIESFLYEKADIIIVVTRSYKSELLKRGISGKKIEIVFNGVDKNQFNYSCKPNVEIMNNIQLNDKFVVGYIGTHGLAHPLEIIVEAAEILKAQTDIIFLMVGNGARKNKIVKLAETKLLKNIHFIDQKPKNELAGILRLCNLGLSVLKDVELYRSVIPSKIFEYFALGLPVLISAPRGEATEIIEKYGAGVSIPPESGLALASEILRLYKDGKEREALGANARLASGHFQRNVQAKKMIDFITKFY